MNEIIGWKFMLFGMKHFIAMVYHLDFYFIPQNNLFKVYFFHYNSSKFHEWTSIGTMAFVGHNFCHNQIIVQPKPNVPLSSTMDEILRMKKFGQFYGCSLFHLDFSSNFIHKTNHTSWIFSHWTLMKFNGGNKNMNELYFVYKI